MAPLVLNVRALWTPESCTTQFMAEICRFRPADGGRRWEQEWHRRREYVWDEGQAVSLRADLLKSAEHMCQEIGWESPF